MEKINWKQKLTLRKFWAALIAVVTTILVAFNVSNLTIEQVVAVITAVAALIGLGFQLSAVLPVLYFRHLKIRLLRALLLIFSAKFCKIVISGL